jgi:hypothetical protein
VAACLGVGDHFVGEMRWTFVVVIERLNAQPRDARRLFAALSFLPTRLVG